MKKQMLVQRCWVTVTLLFGVLAAGTAQTFGKNSPLFISNGGQWDRGASFLARAPGLNLWLTPSGVVYDLHTFVLDKYSQSSGVTRGHVLRMTYANGNRIAYSATGPASTKFSFFQGSSPRSWVSGVKGFAEARSEQIYPGISARYYFENGLPRYDVVVQPGADPSQIALRFEGSEGTHVEPNGNFDVQTSLGAFEQKSLLVYQQQAGQRVSIPSKFESDGETLRFQVGAYDPSKDLIVDPILFATYLGDTGSDVINGVAVDKTGDIFVTGATYSSTFPTTTGAYEGPHYSKQGNAFVSELSPDGTKLLASTFLGGSLGDMANAITIDPEGEPVVTGQTGSSNFPVTSNAFQTTNHGLKNGAGAAFVSKLSADCTKLLASTYLGGSSPDTNGWTVSDQGVAVKVDKDGNLVVGGNTFSTDFPISADAYQTTNNSVSYNPGYSWHKTPFVTRISSDATQLVSSTYLGGSTTSWLTDLALDSEDDAVIVGGTICKDFPITGGAYQSALHTGPYPSAFISRISPDARELVSSTFLGGSNPGWANGVAIDSEDDSVVAGFTTASDFPTTAGAFQPNYRPRENSGFANGFMSKLSADATKLLASTYLGGTGAEFNNTSNETGDGATKIVIGPTGYAVMVGYSSSTNFPITQGAYQTTNNVQLVSFIASMTLDAKTLLYSSYCPTNLVAQQWSQDDAGPGLISLAVTPGGDAVIGATSIFNDLPVTENAYQPVAADTIPGPLSGWPEIGYLTLINMTPAIGIERLSLSPVFVRGGVTGYGVVWLNGPAGPPGFQVHLAATGSVSVPGTITVPQGQFAATFAIKTEPVSSYSKPTITASTGNFQASQVLTVGEATIKSFSVSPTSVVGGYRADLVIRLNGPAGPGGDVVTLYTGESNLAALPATVSVPAGESAVSVPFLSLPASFDQTAFLSASIASSNLVIEFTVKEAPISTLTAVPASVVGGHNSDAIVRLSGKAGPDSDQVAISSTGPISVPPSAFIAPGETAVSFPIKTTAVTKATTATITVSVGNSSKNVTLMVNPPTP